MTGNAHLQFHTSKVCGCVCCVAVCVRVPDEFGAYLLAQLKPFCFRAPWQNVFLLQLLLAGSVA